MERTIHQIFIDIGKIKDISQNYTYDTYQRDTKKYCETHKIQYKLWREPEIEKLLQKYPQWIDLYKGFVVEPIMKVDFIRYLILYDEGGIYLDLDVIPVRDAYELFKEDYFFTRWHEEKLMVYIAILGTKSKNPLFMEILKHCEESFLDKKDKVIYQQWRGRFVFQTTGHYMVMRVLKKQKVNMEEKVHDCISVISKGKYIGKKEGGRFIDNNISLWYQ
jgi:mannosyltransferase OCH1-like enzyme